MQLHMREAHWQPWLRGIAIVVGLFAVPVLAALIWLSFVRVAL
jgi:hypothetical protein